MSHEPWELIPLTKWVWGVTRLHFSGGHVAERRMCQADARVLQRQIDGGQGSDDVTWSLAWFSYRDENVVLLEWDGDPELGWPPFETDERRELIEAGHPRGVLASLLRMWKEDGTRPDPRYCHAALWTLHQAAREGIEAGAWRRLAMSLEGERGAESLRFLAEESVTKSEPGVDDGDVGRDAADNDEVRDETTPSSQAPSGPPPSDVLSDEDDSVEPADPRIGDDSGGPDEAPTQ